MAEIEWAIENWKKIKKSTALAHKLISRPTFNTNPRRLMSIQINLHIAPVAEIGHAPRHENGRSVTFPSYRVLRSFFLSNRVLRTMLLTYKLCRFQESYHVGQHDPESLVSAFHQNRIFYFNAFSLSSLAFFGGDDFHHHHSHFKYRRESLTWHVHFSRFIIARFPRIAGPARNLTMDGRWYRWWFFFDDDESNAMDVFLPIATQDHLAGLTPLCSSAENEQLSNRLRPRPRPRDERDTTCDTTKEAIPFKKDFADIDQDVFNENMKNLLWPPDASDISVDDRCPPTFPFHLCCMELSDPIRMVPGELIPGASIIIYKEASTCVAGTRFPLLASFRVPTPLIVFLPKLRIAASSLQVPCFRPIDVCCQTTFPALDSLDGSVDGFTCYKFSAITPRFRNLWKDLDLNLAI